jgi:hypothetical protein
MQFLLVGSNFCRQLLSDSQSPTTPSLLANAPYYKVCSEIAPYSIYMPDAIKKPSETIEGLTIMCNSILCQHQCCSAFYNKSIGQYY